jgi:hypothetical protein
MSDDELSLRDDDAADSSSEVAVALVLEGYLSDLEAGRPEPIPVGLRIDR